MVSMATCSLENLLSGDTILHVRVFRVKVKCSPEALPGLVFTGYWVNFC